MAISQSSNCIFAIRLFAGTLFSKLVNNVQREITKNISRFLCIFYNVENSPIIVNTNTPHLCLKNRSGFNICFNPCLKIRQLNIQLVQILSFSKRDCLNASTCASPYVCSLVEIVRLTLHVCRLVDSSSVSNDLSIELCMKEYIFVRRLELER